MSRNALPRELPRDDRLVRPTETALKLGYKHRTSLYELVRRGVLPPPIRITARVVGWRESFLNEFLAERERAGQSE